MTRRACSGRSSRQRRTTSPSRRSVPAPMSRLTPPLESRLTLWSWLLSVSQLVVINPGNPTGGCLSDSDMEAIIRLCHKHDILLLADEVYQANVFDPKNKPFHSFKKVLSSMGAPYHDEVPLVSFHSISKGYSGECGRRGGFLEIVNVDDKVLEQIYKISSVNLCPPLSGQIGVDCLVRPPVEGGESYALWKEETEGIKDALRDRSLFMRERFAKLEGVSCQQAEVSLDTFVIG